MRLNANPETPEGLTSTGATASPLRDLAAHAPDSTRLPRRGRSRDTVHDELVSLRSGDADWRSGRTFSLVYFAGDDVIDVIRDATAQFPMENALSPLAFPSLKKLENEILAIAAELFHGVTVGGETAKGSLTTGGTESILMALKTAREWGRAKGIEKPKALVPVSAHPAFPKGAHYLGIEIVPVPLTADYRADVAAARALCDEDTVIIVGSAPSYPQGVVDPIEELGALAQERGILCHVDACVGGFLLPFVEKLGEPVPLWDFRVPGVTSISADLHKYGYTAKGASVVIYRDSDLRKHQYYTFTEWSGGLYVSPTMTGTRSGAAIAAAWAVLNYLGEEGYVRLARRVLDTARKLQRGIAATPGLRLCGSPVASIFSFTSERFDIFALGQAMGAKGWRLDFQQKPPSLHLMITPAHEAHADRFLIDLLECLKGLDPSAAPEGDAAVYGMLATLDDRGSVGDFLKGLLDGIFTPEPAGATKS